MAASFDLNLLPLYRIKGQEWPQLPGLLAALPPKHPARGRENDSLFGYLVLSGNAPFSSAEYNQLCAMLVERFYKCPGALTSALRVAAEALNQFLVDRNLRTTGKGHYVLGKLAFGVLRAGQAFIAQSGPLHIFHISSSETRHYPGDQLAGRGLGTSQSMAIHFSQYDLLPGDLMVMCSAVPTGWEDLLQNERNSKLDLLRRKLFSLSNEDMNAVLVQAQPGKGMVTVLRPALASSQPAQAPRPEPVRVQPTSEVTGDAGPIGSAPVPVRPTSQVSSELPAARFSQALSGQEDGLPRSDGKSSVEPSIEQPASIQNEPTSPPRRVISRLGPAAPQKKGGLPGRFVGHRPVGAELPEIIRPDSPQRQVIFRGLAKWMRGVRVLTHNTSEKIRAFLPNLLPNLRDDEPKVSTTSLAFIAIAIPVLIVTVALIFYNQFGKTASFQENYDQAFASAVWASGQTSPADIRLGWERTLYYLDTAESFKITDDSRNLRIQARTALDNLDNIMRLGFSPAIVGGISRSMIISAMAATTTDLYLLDSTRGIVERYYEGAQGYHADTQFECQPGTYDGVIVGTLIDVIAAPKVNPYKATLMALDANGALVFCSPGPSSTPSAIQLLPPELGWNGISAFTLDYTTGYLYILDPLKNAIWYYMPDENGKYTISPKMFFGEQVPANMSTVIDLATNGSDMYLLFSDGHAAACTLVEFQGVPKRCVDPIQFVDNRPERESGQRIADAAFTEMTFTDAPDQALYFFDPFTQAVYRFSARPDSLILLGQFRAPEDQRATMLAEKATVTTISPSRSLFIAVSGQVYFASDIP